MKYLSAENYQLQVYGISISMPWETYEQKDQNKDKNNHYTLTLETCFHSDHQHLQGKHINTKWPT